MRQQEEETYPSATTGGPGSGPQPPTADPVDQAHPQSLVSLPNVTNTTQLLRHRKSMKWFMFAIITAKTSLLLRAEQQFKAGGSHR